MMLGVGFAELKPHVKVEIKMAQNMFDFITRHRASRPLTAANICG